MKKILICLLSFLSISATSFGQSSGEKILFVIDSIPLFNDPEDWNAIDKEDIAEITIIRNKDSLKWLRPEQLDGIIYIFTKAYRNRPDGLKRIPSLKQMVMTKEGWNLNGALYTGKYIDYYNSGKIQNEGTLLNGKLNGVLTVYFKNGNNKSVTSYKKGIPHGDWKEYYPNGMLMNSRTHKEGKGTGDYASFFINGQIMEETRPGKAGAVDTAFSYYSTGKVKQMKLIKNKKPVFDKKTSDYNGYNTYFFQSINKGELKDANKYFYLIWKVDSTSSDTHFKKGLLLMKEFRFDAAIEAFDEALNLEPLMRETLVHRAIARIKKYKYPKAKPLSNDINETHLTMQHMITIPADEQVKICADLRQSIFVDFSELYVPKLVPSSILNFCQNK